VFTLTGTPKLPKKTTATTAAVQPQASEQPSNNETIEACYFAKSGSEDVSATNY
jgi:hypothetical protein